MSECRMRRTRTMARQRTVQELHRTWTRSWRILSSRFRQWKLLPRHAAAIVVWREGGNWAARRGGPGPAAPAAPANCLHAARPKGKGQTA
jgi:hypothetical protein